MNFFRLVLLVWAIWPGQIPSLYAQNWKELEPGLELGTFQAEAKSIVGDGQITVLRVCPDQFSFHLICASELGGSAKTAENWAKSQDLVAVTNTGMFQMDGLTSVGYMKNFDHVNQPRTNNDNSIIAFNPIDTGLPEFQIIDRSCQDWPVLQTKYNSCVQGIRMVNCHQKNVWSQQPRIWSMAVMAQDEAGNALFIFTRSPYSVHDFIDMLQKMPLRIRKMQYLEGGPEASLYIRTPDFQASHFGSYESGFYESDENDRAWPIPNAIGIKRK